MTNNKEQQMNAVVMQASGPPAQALTVRTEPVPEPGPGEVLVEVHAAGVNPFDVVIAAGKLGSPLPMIPGIDFAGVVVSDGDLNGQEVWGSQAYLGWKRPGTHAQFVALPRTWLSRKPEHLTMTEAGAVGRPYIAAWQAVINIMDLKPGETILITGGAGLVGQTATAIAHWRGAKPIIADVRKPEGAEDFIDTSSHDLPEAVRELTGGRGADMVLDTIGGALFEPAVRSLRFGGRLTGLHNHERVEFNPSESTTTTGTSRDSPACSSTGLTARTSSTNLLRSSTADCLMLRPQRHGRWRTASRPIRGCRTGRPE
jgi:NADPH:quinone reductase